WITIWFFLHKVVKTKISLPRALLVSIIANIVSAVLGLVLQAALPIYSAFNLKNLSANLVILSFAFITSIIIEWRIHRAYIKFKNRGWFRLKSAALANLFSYLILTIYVICISTWFPQATRFNVPFMEAQSNIGSILRAQKEFYLENSRFTNKFKQLKELDLVISKQNGRQAKGFYFLYSLSADKAKVKVQATPNKTARDTGKKLRSNTAILLSQPEFTYGICQTKQPATIAPKPPQIVNGEVQCAADSDVLNVTYSGL
ncbi:MAG: type IV pilin-like G/H family protein, partial [Spirulinaceae cyanobacterium]